MLEFRKVVEKVAQFEKIAADPYEDIAHALEVFEVNLNFDPNALKTKYRKLSKKYHPDLNRGDPVAERKFKEIAAAYGTLTGPANKRLIKQLRKEKKITPRKIRWSFRTGPAAAVIHPDIQKLKEVFGSLQYLNSRASDKLKKDIAQFLKNLESATDPSPRDIKEAQYLYKEAWRVLRAGGFIPIEEAKRRKAVNFLLMIVLLFINFSPIILPILFRLSKPAYKSIRRLLKKANKKFGAGKNRVKEKIRWLVEKIKNLPQKEQEDIQIAVAQARKKHHLRIRVPA